MIFPARARFSILSASLLLAGLAAAAAAMPRAARAAPLPPPPETLPQAVPQVDGITSAVVDKLWAGTDHYWHEGDYYRIVALLRVCVEADPTFVDAYGNAAWLLWSLGDTQGADRFLRYGLNKTPNAWELEYEFGWHLFNTKRYANALPYLRGATQNKAASVNAWKQLAHCYDKLGRFAESAATWQEVVTRFPGDGAAPKNLARVRAKLAPATPGTL